MTKIRQYLLILFTAAAVTISLTVFAPVDAQQSTPAGDPKPAAASPTPPPEDDDEVIKVDTDVVNVLFTAQDRNRRLLTGLKQEDVRLLENGEAQEITAFARQIDLPLSLAILIDVSASQ
jgi:hypothetical protein